MSSSRVPSDLHKLNSRCFQGVFKVFSEKIQGFFKGKTSIIYILLMIYRMKLTDENIDIIFKYLFINRELALVLGQDWRVVSCSQDCWIFVSQPF